MGKSVKPSGEPSVVQVQQRNHGETAWNGSRPRHGRLSVAIGLQCWARYRTWRVPSTGWYSSPVTSSNTIAGRPVSNMV